MSIIVACLVAGNALALAWLVNMQRRLASLPLEPPPPEPAQKAAGLDRPKSARPHPPPQRATLLGIRPPPPAPAEDDRPSDDEVTRVGERPPGMLGTAKTLASMVAVVLPEKKEGAK